MGGLPPAVPRPGPAQGLVLTILFLVRHGVTDATGTRLYGRTEGVHLSQRGRDQAEDLARRLASLPIEAVYTSPLERCRETAEPIAAALGLRARPEPALLETDAGNLTGRTYAQIRRTRAWRRIWAVPSMSRYPGGESLAGVHARVVGFLEAVGERHPRGVVAAVSHGDPIRMALAHCAGLHLDHFERLQVAPGSVSAVALGDGPPRVLLVDDTGDLGDLVPRRTRRR